MPEDCRSCHKYCLLFLTVLLSFDLQLVVVQIVVSLYDLKINSLFTRIANITQNARIRTVSREFTIR